MGEGLVRFRKPLCVLSLLSFASLHYFDSPWGNVAFVVTSDSNFGTSSWRASRCMRVHETRQFRVYAPLSYAVSGTLAQGRQLITRGFFQKPFGDTSEDCPPSVQENLHISFEEKGSDDRPAANDEGYRVNGLPVGWAAIYSEEYQREYFWHRASGTVTWDAPTPQQIASDDESDDVALDAPTPQQIASDDKSDDVAFLALAGPVIADFCFDRDWSRLRSTVKLIRKKTSLGESLGMKNFRLVRALLEHHPNVTAKVGVGVRAITVESHGEPGKYGETYRAFWVFRTDGTSDNFSTNKCIWNLANRWKEAVER